MPAKSAPRRQEQRPPEAPTGTVAFLFTDIEGSTRLARSLPDEFESLQERHRSILREAFAHDGFEVGTDFVALIRGRLKAPRICLQATAT